MRSLFRKAFSDDVEHPLFDVGKIEARKLFLTERGQQRLREYDKKLYKALKNWIEQHKLSKQYVKGKLDKWITSRRKNTGDVRRALRKPTRVEHRATIVGRVNRPLQILHADLADVTRLNPDRKIYRYRFVLVVVDAFSNYTVLVPMKNKSSQSALDAFKQAFKQLGVRRRNECSLISHIQTDQGSEFLNRDLEIELKKRDVRLFSSGGTGKAYLAESKIGQMKRGLVRISQLLEREVKKFDKKRSKKKKVVDTIFSGKRKSKKKSPGNDDAEDAVPFKEYADDWSRYLRKLQDRLNNKVNTRTGFTPKRLFEQFRDGRQPNDPGERARGAQDFYTRNPNETKDLFEPMEDTLVRHRLLMRRTREQARQARKQKRLGLTKKIKTGDTVYLTKSRLKRLPSETPEKLFGKRSVDLDSEWDLKKPFIVREIIARTQSEPKTYALFDPRKNVLIRHRFYREELLKTKL